MFHRAAALKAAIPLLAALALGACAYPDYATGRAPDYPAGYQPVMGGYATQWPAQPGALWGPEDVPAIDVFFEPLGRHGRWMQSRWGQVFVPNAPRDWRPYANGQWLENRFWLSNDPWGWATDHYGRWGFDEQLGWVWVPGTQWGPSWVAWREAEEVVGWAPIPPQVQWNVGIGFGSGWGYDNWNSWYGPSWLWLPRSSLFLPGFGGNFLPWNSGFNWWNRSRWQHSPYWGWNQGWNTGWGWQAPPPVWNNWANQYPHWGNWGWNRPRWHNNGWNGGNWNGGGWNRYPPRRGAPGSVGDRIGRDLSGQPPAGWQGDGRRPDGWGRDGRRDGSGALNGQQWNNRGNGNWGNRGNRGGRWNGGQPGQGVTPPPAPGGMRGAPPPRATVAGAVGGAVGGAMGGTVTAPPPRPAPQVRYQPPPPQPRSQPAPQPRSEAPQPTSRYLGAERYNNQPR
jgi:hypothetical protein